MHIVTFITDWNSEDYYLGALKGQILQNSLENSISFVDVCNNIKKYNTEQVLYVLRSNYSYFPKNTIHVITINKKPNELVDYIIVKFDNHYFVSPNTGLLDILVGSSDYEAFKLKIPKNYNAAFPGVSNIPLAIKYIVNNTLEVDTESFELSPKNETLPLLKENIIVGTIVHIDSYGNLITNVSKEIFYKYAAKSDKFSILLKNRNYIIDKITAGYSGDFNHIVALFNSQDLLEIAHVSYSANKSLGLLVGDKIKIQYYDNKNHKI